MLAALPSPSSVAPASPPPSILPDALSVLLIAAIAVLPHKRRFKDEQALVVGFASAIPVFADTAGASIHRRRIGTALVTIPPPGRPPPIARHCPLPARGP
uniref:Uncharacterized protein n=1 Tax=Oryza nivara TaxID=4536 RepID=A0A0E0J2G2_ORYNI